MKIKEFCKKYILRFPVIELIVFALVIFADQLSKGLVADAAKGDPMYAVNVLGSFLQIRYAENTGASWSILADKPWAQTFFLILSSVVIPCFIAYLIIGRKKSKLFRISVTLIIAGALGNFIDRVFLGYVRDFISFSFFNPIFNIADSSLSIGVCLFILYALLDIFKEQKAKKAGVQKCAEIREGEDGGGR